MKPCTRLRATRALQVARGFTLLELMIAVAIVGILSALAYPSYVEHVKRTRRGDAKSVLLEAAQWAERDYTLKNTYGATTLPTQFTTSPRGSGSPFYAIAFATGASAPSATQFYLVATPTGSMQNDACGSFVITQDGTRTLLTPTSGTIASCWDR